MAKKKDVGTSWRTWIKHALMWRFVRDEVSALSRMHYVPKSCWFDTTAGNGMAVDETGGFIDKADFEFWSQHCSQGILIGWAMKSHKPVAIMSYELKPATFLVLVEQLGFQLDRLGFTVCADNEDQFAWIGKSYYGHDVTITVTCGSGHTATIGHIEKNDAVLVINDPNNVHHWSIRDGFAADIMKRTKFLRMFHAIGALNILKQLERPLRDRWFEFINAEQTALHPKHDLLLVTIAKDEWGYMIRTSDEWRDKTQSAVRTAFKAAGTSLLPRMAWFRRDPEQYRTDLTRLFLTQNECQGEELLGDNLSLFELKELA
jgi:hypothetical protein